MSALGAGNLELETDWGIRGWMEPVEDRTVLKLFVELIERPELYDFLFGSGVVLDEDGVEIFRGSIDGERDDARISGAKGKGLIDTWAAGGG